MAPSADTTALDISSPAFIRQHYLKRSIRLYIIGIVIVGLAVAYISIEQYLQLSETRTIVATQQQTIDRLEKDQQQSSLFLSQTKERYKDLQATMNKELAIVFPYDEQYTLLTKEFDAYFLQHNRTTNPIVVTDLTFGTPAASKDNTYMTLPIQMNISSSEDNFFKFLAYIQQSGTLADKVRLINLKATQLTFSDDTADSQKRHIQFRVDLEAYFQKIDTPAS